MKVVSVIWAIVRGLLRALANDYVGRRPKGGRKAAKERPWWAEEPAAPKKEGGGQAQARDAAHKEAAAPEARATAPSWWGKPAPPPTPPTIKVETDEGTFVAAATFSGEHMMGIRRVERPRQEGESRRRRRGPRAAEGSPVVQAEVEACAREPEVPEELGAEASTQLVRRDVVETGIKTTGSSRARPEGRAVPIEPGEKPRVERATRVRSRLGPAGEPSSPWVATTLATRLALTRATGALAKKGDGG